MLDPSMIDQLLRERQMKVDRINKNAWKFVSVNQQTAEPSEVAVASRQSHELVTECCGIAVCC